MSEYMLAFTEPFPIQFVTTMFSANLSVNARNPRGEAVPVGQRCGPQSHRVMLVDRNCITRLGLRMVFEQENHLQVVAEAGCAKEAMDLFAEHRPHMVVLDTCLPDCDGLELAQEFLTQQSRVLIFSHHLSLEEVRRAYVAKVHGYVTKSSSQEDLLRAVNLLLKGRFSFPDQHLAKMRELSCQCPLSNREMAVLSLIAKGFSNKEAAFQLSVSEATAKTFLARTMKKLGVHDRTQAVMAALDRGWITRD